MKCICGNTSGQFCPMHPYVQQRSPGVVSEHRFKSTHLAFRAGRNARKRGRTIADCFYKDQARVDAFADGWRYEERLNK